MPRPTIDEIRRKIREKNLHWEVNESQYLDFSSKRPSDLLGFIPGPGEKTLEEREKSAKQKFENSKGYDSSAAASTLPNSFDLRNVNGRNYITPVRDQLGCGSCVAFGTAASAEGTLRRQEDNPNLNLDYSEADLFYCYGGSAGRTCQNGWWPRGALAAFEDGVVDDPCFTYTAGNQPCNLCSDSDRHVNRIREWENLTSASEMKEWIVNTGPLIACFDVYPDFFAYTSGVYQTTHTNPDDIVGGHCVCCVGYDDIAQCWICKNSWGLWGDNGYFRIAYGDCGIDDEMQGIKGVYSVRFLSQILSSKGFGRPMQILIIAQEFGLTRPFLVSQLMDKLT